MSGSYNRASHSTPSTAYVCQVCHQSVSYFTFSALHSLFVLVFWFVFCFTKKCPLIGIQINHLGGFLFVCLFQIHGKRRNLDALVEAWTPLGLMFQCRPDRQCKGSSNDPMAMQSMVAAAAMYSNPAGLAGMAPLLGMGVIPPAQSQVICAVHNKKRDINHLQQHPGWPLLFSVQFIFPTFPID
jgi:hypothetical protein